MTDPTPTKYFDITPSDIMDFLNVGREVGYLQVTQSSKPGYVSPTTVARILSMSERTVISQLPSKYAEKCRGIFDGVVLEKWATVGQTEIYLPEIMRGYVSNVTLYKNYPMRLSGMRQHPSYRVYAERIEPDEYHAYTYEQNLGKLVLDEPACEGDSFIADLRCASVTWISEIKGIIIKFAVSDILNSLGSATDRQAVASQKFQLDAYNYIARLHGRSNDKIVIGISSIEEIPCIPEAQIRGQGLISINQQNYELPFGW